MVEKRFKWLINLRWLAACGVLIATVLIDKVFAFPLPLRALYGIAALLLLSNLLYLYLYNRATADAENKYTKHQRLVIIEIVGDLILLTLLLHFTGGVENPFIIYYVFHMVLASILLPRKISFLLTSFAIFLVGLLAFGEYNSWFTHFELSGFISVGFYNDIRYLTGTGFVFVTTSYVVVYMTSTVSSLLRKRENAYRKANRELQLKDTIKDEYVFRITHDIKGHLAAIKNCLDASLSDLPPDQQRMFLDRAYTRNEKLLDFIRELLRITQLRLNNEMVFTSFSLKELVADLFSSYKEQARENGIEFLAELEVDQLVADRLSIMEVIENLLTNSMKYTNPDGKIIFSSKINPTGKIILQIADTGIGIPRDEMKKVFREFYKASNNKGRVKDGTGMGLAIVRMIVENHNGSVKVESKVNKGTVFTLELPELSVTTTDVNEFNTK